MEVELHITSYVGSKDIKSYKARLLAYSKINSSMTEACLVGHGTTALTALQQVEERLQALLKPVQDSIQQYKDLEEFIKETTK